MSLIDKLVHLLIPRESNNHKAKILHPSGLFALALFLIIFQGVLGFAEKKAPSVLGFAAQISIDEVVALTNSKRAEKGLPPLTLNQTLSSAAFTKGRDMIDRDYWAHTAPDGTTPWSFFNRFGYKYRYAGENLARDFNSASAAVEAWMNSPTHRDNILNPKYKEIGIGITEGDLAGSDTTIIVQFFGATSGTQVRVAEAASTTQTPVLARQVSPRPTVVPTQTLEIVAAKPVASAAPVLITNLPLEQEDQKVLISPFNTTKTLSFGVAVLLLVVFLADAYLVSKRRITRIAGRSFAHFIFLLMLLSIVIIIRSGQIL